MKPISFFPNTIKKNGRHGKIPMYRRVIIDRTKTENDYLLKYQKLILETRLPCASEKQKSWAMANLDNALAFVSNDDI